MASPRCRRVFRQFSSILIVGCSMLIVMTVLKIIGDRSPVCKGSVPDKIPTKLKKGASLPPNARQLGSEDKSLPRTSQIGKHHYSHDTDTVLDPGAIRPFPTLPSYPLKPGGAGRHYNPGVLLSFFQSELTAEDKEIFTNILGTIDRVCRENNITYFMSAGTLLGSYRHHGMIPWDVDADIHCSVRGKAKLTEAFSKHAPDYVVHTPLHTRYPGLLKVYYKWSNITVDEWKWPAVDIFLYAENQTHIWDIPRNLSGNTVPSSSKLYRRFEKRVLFPLHRRPFGNIFLNAPRDSFAYLKLFYDSTGCLKQLHRQYAIQIPCKELENVVPFVYREGVANGSGVKEKLMMGDTVLQEFIIDEPSYAVTKRYSLELVEHNEDGRDSA
ncbi:uncharacterized protein LOC106172818 [Lingula anatina]|uniref:Uncharacterized protein LOC106172818 n=1 Tax=Lingula anatina TaxID=7574 RepID=A0A1S3JFP2_LINAN|nr:uncharacterized protein LOC106172818 [Lingula anatina]|eukprot:XP_013409178.1 uncharacterized protein LOC106172818 [Lingula anatina]